MWVLENKQTNKQTWGEIPRKPQEVAPETEGDAPRIVNTCFSGKTCSQASSDPGKGKLVSVSRGASALFLQ